VAVCEPWVDASPVSLTPCPAGWEETEDDEGTAVCDPWPATTPVQMTPCPEGWRTVEDGPLTYCDPWPSTGPDTCGRFEAHFPGTPGCQRIGSDCAPSGWPENLPPGRPVVYVRPGAGPGDGSLALPYPSYADIPAAQLTPGTIVALSTGTHVGNFEPADGITLWGACPADTVLTSSGPFILDAVLTVTSSSTVRNLSVRDATRPGVSAAGIQARATLRDLVVERVSVSALFAVDAARLDAERIIVRDVQPLNGEFGRGLVATDRSQVRVQHGLFEDLTSAGLMASGAGTELQVERSVVRRVDLDNNLGLGWGVISFARGRATVTESAVDDTVAAGVATEGLGSELTVHDSFVTHAAAPGSFFGFGATAVNGAEMEVRRTRLEGNEAGLQAAFGGQVESEDVVVRNNQVGLWVQSENLLRNVAALRSQRVFVDGFSIEALLVFKGDLDVRDLVVGPSRSTADAVAILNDGPVRLERVAIGLASEPVFVLAGADLDLEVVDVVIRQHDPQRPSPVAIDHNDGSARFRRTRIQGAFEHILQASAGVSLEVTDILVTGTGSRDRASPALDVVGAATVDFERVRMRGFGRVADVREAASVSLARSHITGANDGPLLRVAQGGDLTVVASSVEQAESVALIADGSSSRAELVDAVFRGTTSRASDGRRGRGIEVRGAATVIMNRVHLTENRQAAMVGFDLGTRIQGQNLAIGPTRVETCATETCAARAVGVAAYRGADVELEFFEVTGSETCGLHVASAGRAILGRGRFVGNAVGACIDDPAYDLETNTAEVRFEDDPAVANPARQDPLEPFED
jgi:hypothetical protein